MATDSNTLRLEVATPKGLVLAVDAVSVQAPSVSGEFGVLPGHLPMLAALKCGVLSYTEGNQTFMAAVDRGFVEVGPGKVLVLTESCAKPDEVDADAARQELADATKRLAATKEPTTSAEYQEALRDQEWAEARLRILATH